MKRLHIGSSFQSALDFFKENYEYLLPFSLLFLLLSLPGMFIDSAIVSILYLLILPLQFGIQYYAHIKTTTGNADFSTFFQVYKKAGRYFLAIFFKAIVLLLILIPGLIPLMKNIDYEVFTSENPQLISAHIQSMDIPSFAIFAFMASISLMFFIAPLFYFIEYYFIFQSISLGDAISKSFKSAMQNYLQIILMSLVYGSLFILGILFCGIGIIFTMPIAFCLLYFSYRELEIE